MVAVVAERQRQVLAVAQYQTVVQVQAHIRLGDQPPALVKTSAALITTQAVAEEQQRHLQVKLRGLAVLAVADKVQAQANEKYLAQQTLAAVAAVHQTTAHLGTEVVALGLSSFDMQALSLLLAARW